MTLGEYTILPYTQGVSAKTVSLGDSGRVTRPRPADLPLHPAHPTRTPELRGTQVWCTAPTWEDNRRRRALGPPTIPSACGLGSSLPVSWSLRSSSWQGAASGR